MVDPNLRGPSLTKGRRSAILYRIRLWCELSSMGLRRRRKADLQYSPIPPPGARRPMTSSSAVPNVLTAALSKVVRRGPLDEDDELQLARGAVEKLEERWGSAAAAVGNLGKARRGKVFGRPTATPADEVALALANAEMGGKFVSLSTVESDAGLAQAERKMGRTLEQLSGMGGAQVCPSYHCGH